MLSRRGAALPSSSVSDSVKKRYFNVAAGSNETDDCSFATITLPFQRTFTLGRYIHPHRAPTNRDKYSKIQLPTIAYKLSRNWGAGS